MKTNDWKERLGVMYSTNPDFKYETAEELEEETWPKEKQPLRVSLDKRNRGGKMVTLVTGFHGTADDLATLGKLLRVKCGGEMRCRWIRERWGDHRPGRFPRAGGRDPAGRGLCEEPSNLGIRKGYVDDLQGFRRSG